MVEGLAIPAIDIVDVNNIAATDPAALVEALARVMQPDLDDHPVTPGTADRSLANNARTLTDNTCNLALETLKSASERLGTTNATGVLAQLCEAVIKACSYKTLEEQVRFLSFNQ
ncbi:uncharacterized protein LOC144884233 [Branchiostoma floridae x Branchiostoma japonicum]